MLVFFIPIALFAFVWWEDLSFSRKVKDRRSTKIQLIGLLASLLIIGIPLILVNSILPSLDFNPDEWISRPNLVLASSIILSGMISFCWYLFISWLDIYEKEKFIYIFITFAMACGSTFLVFAITPFWDFIGLRLNNTFFNDFIYATIRIGATEEFVKIIPFLIMYWFSKQIDEPFDFILFGATSALGFAFIENIIYLKQGQLDPLNGRVFYATVSHMFDTGIICYCMAIAKYKGKSILTAGLIGYVLASLAHGFYDVWLMSDFGFSPDSNSRSFAIFTTVFFLVSIHLFATMKNNLVNISHYYEPEKHLDVVLNKTRLFNLLLLILFVGHIAFYMVHNAETANNFLIDSLYSYTFIMIYLVLSFNSTNIVHGYLAPLTVPRALLLPLTNRHPDYLGLKVKMCDTKRGNRKIGAALPLDGVFAKRVVVEGDLNWYHFAPDTPHPGLEGVGDLIVKPAKMEYFILLGKYQFFRVALAPNGVEDKVTFEKSELKFLGNILIGKSALEEN